MVEKIVIRCPKCGRTGSTPRVASDYPETVSIEVMCDACNHGDFDEQKSFDAAGNHITRDPCAELSRSGSQT